MKKALAIVMCIVAVCFASCNKEKPNQKFIGSYQGNSIVDLTISALGQTLPFDSITANVAMEITAGSTDDKVIANFTIENKTRTLNGTVNNNEISFEPLTVKENIEGSQIDITINLNGNKVNSNTLNLSGNITGNGTIVLEDFPMPIPATISGTINGTLNKLLAE